MTHVRADSKKIIRRVILGVRDARKEYSTEYFWSAAVAEINSKIS